MICQHKKEILNVTASDPGCSECLKTGDKWVHLRICLMCGQVGCCDESKNKHASRHYHETGHPVIQSFEPDELWGWCFEDSVLLKFKGRQYRLGERRG